MKKTTTYLLIFLVSLLFAGCTLEQRCQRRLVFLQKNCPQCFDKLTIRDTLIKEGWIHDTTFIFSHDTIPDTFNISKDNTEVQITHNGDSVRVVIKQKTDTVYLESEVPAIPPPDEPQPEAESGGGAWWKLLLAVFGTILIIWFIRKKL